MFRLPLTFIATGIVSFIAFHVLSLFSLGAWVLDPPRNPEGWFRAHLLILDWATMIAMGAVYQLMDVILQRRIHSTKLGYANYAAFFSGSVVLLAGFLLMRIWLIAAGATLAVIGFLLFAYNVGRTLLQAKQWNSITISTACAILYLVLTGLIGMMMGINFVYPLWWEGHERLFGAHIWLGTLGWFGMLITGFSYKMLPMFYLSHGAPVKLEKVVIALWNAGVIVGALGFLLGGGSFFSGLAVLLIVGALIAYVFHMRNIRKHKFKGSPGKGIWWTVASTYALIAFGAVLIVAWIFHPAALWNAKFTLLAGWMYIWGWVAMTILGYLSKIVPFLWWTHKYGPQAGKPNVPVMADLINDRYVGYGLAGMAAGLVALLVGVGADVGTLIWLGGCILSLFALFYMSLIIRVFSR